MSDLDEQAVAGMVALLADDRTEEAVLVQCSLAWLFELDRQRDELDEALLARLLRADGFRAAQLVWHDVPNALVEREGRDPARAHRSHADWVRRLTAALTLVDPGPPAARQVLRRIEREGSPVPPRPGDCLAVRQGGTWTSLQGDGATASAWLSAPLSTTPLLPTVVDLLGPPEDLDPTMAL